MHAVAHKSYDECEHALVLFNQIHETDQINQTDGLFQQPASVPRGLRATPFSTRMCVTSIVFLSLAIFSC